MFTYGFASAGFIAHKVNGGGVFVCKYFDLCTKEGKNDWYLSTLSTYEYAFT